MSSAFNQIYQHLRLHGKETAPRGQRTLEILNYTYTLPPYLRFTTFPSRKLNLQYIKDELKWYLRGDLHDLSICEKAKIWTSCVNEDEYGGQWLNSNYGHYLFKRKRFNYVVDCLRGDKDSRRAVATILGGSEHLYLENKDVPCTVSMGFRIRDNRLLCTVHMRSQDAVFGLGNDVPFFSVVQEMVMVSLRDTYPLLGLGELTVFVESFHVYERHFDLLPALCEESTVPVDCPIITDEQEVQNLLSGNHMVQYDFTRWLNASV